MPLGKVDMSSRTQRTHYAIRDIALKASELEKQGKTILRLNIGDPVRAGFKTPKSMTEALEKIGEEGYDFYSDSAGQLELREKLVEKEKKYNQNMNLDPEKILISAGGSEALNFIYAALLNPKDQVLIPDVHYPIFKSLGDFYDADVVQYSTSLESDWQPSAEDIQSKITEKTKAIVLNSPNNPTGAMYSRKELQKIIDLAGEHKLPLISDETYDLLTFDNNKHQSIASMSKDVAVLSVGSFSKVFLAPGWRVGYAYLHDPHEQIENVWEGVERQGRVRLSACSPLQKACTLALGKEEQHLPGFINELDKRRNTLYNRLQEIPEITVMKPKGAFYMFPKIDMEALDLKDDLDFVTTLLNEFSILTVHGSGFGSGGKNHLRIVSLESPEILERAAEQIETFVQNHRNKS